MHVPTDVCNCVKSGAKGVEKSVDAVDNDLWQSNIPARELSRECPQRYTRPEGTYPHFIHRFFHMCPTTQNRGERTKGVVTNTGKRRVDGENEARDSVEIVSDSVQTALDT